MARKIGLNNREMQALEALKRLRFAVRDHLASELNLEPVTTHRLIAKLEGLGLVKSFKELKPYVYRLSDRGAAKVEADYQQRWHSAPAIHQYLMANSFEIFYRNNFNAEFKMVNPMRLRSHGLNCAVAEHPARLGKDLILVLIDDYQMRPRRVHHCLDRIHSTATNHEYLERVRQTGVAKVPTWRSAIKGIYIVTTNPNRERYFSVHIKKNPIDMESRIFSIEPIWRIG